MSKVNGSGQECPLYTRKSRCLVQRLFLCLVLLFTVLFAGTFACQGLLESLLLARFQVVGVTLYFLNDVFRLNLAFESTKGIL